MPDLFNKLLSNCKKALGNLSTFDIIKIVLGNESCDLDSTVSSLVYSLFLAQQTVNKNTIVLPIINVKEVDFPIKTEVNYFCKSCGVETQQFIFRDQIDLHKLKDAGKLELVLVDHHILSSKDEALQSAVVEVIDHRPIDPTSCWSNDTVVCIELVGSCCTLIARKLLSTAPMLLTPNISKLLYGTIILDTACLSKTARIAQPMDFEIVAKLQQICEGHLNSEEIFKNINAAKSDLSGLTKRQILVKDMKFVSGIPIFGLPILVQKFLSLPDAATSVAQFCEEEGFEVAVLMGLSLSTTHLERDISVYWHSVGKETLMSELVKDLQENNFDLVEITLPGLSRQFKVYSQNNILFSRKKVVPIVQRIAEQRL